MKLFNIYKSLNARPVTLFFVFAISTGANLSNAAFMMVNTNSGLYTEDSLCSLPEAIVASNTNEAYMGCPAGGPTDSNTDYISLPPGTIDLSQLDEKIELHNTSIIFSSSATRTTIIGGKKAFFEVQPKGSATFMRVRLTGFTNAYSPVIKVWGEPNDIKDWEEPNSELLDLKIIDAEIDHNYARNRNGGIMVEKHASASIRRSIMHNNKTRWGGGGAIEVKGGQVFIQHSLLTQNRAHSGGAVSVTSADFPAVLPVGHLHVEHSTISHNTARSGTGGAIHASRNIYVNLRHATIVKNTVKRGYWRGNAISHTGSPQNTGLIHMARSIIANNGSNTESCTVSHGDTTYSSVGYNYIENCQRERAKKGLFSRGGDFLVPLQENVALPLEDLPSFDEGSWTQVPGMRPLIYSVLDRAIRSAYECVRPENYPYPAAVDQHGRERPTCGSAPGALEP